MSIDRDALIATALRAMFDARNNIQDVYTSDYAEAAVDAILPAVEQDIRAAEQRGREQGRRDVLRVDYDDWIAALRSIREGHLARGGSTDEEQTP